MENPAEVIVTSIVKKIVKGIVIFLIFVIVIGTVVYGTQWLWNWLVPDLFGGPVLTYWQTLGLLVLTRILLFPLTKGGHRPWHKGGGYWAGRWKSMTPEQRERLKARMEEKWCRPRQDAPITGEGTVPPRAG